MQKYIKYEHSARDLAHGAWVSINFRGRGSGKRAMSSAAKDDSNLTRAERIELRKKELLVVMIQLKEMNHGATIHLMNHINQSLAQGDRVIEAALLHLYVAVLQQIRSQFDTTNDVIHRSQHLAKIFFEQDTANITCTISAMKLCEEALKLVTTVKIYENYMDRNGRMSWEDFKDKVDEVLLNHSKSVISRDSNP